MAYMDQQTKARIAAELKKVMPSGWKYSLSVQHHSKIMMTITAAPVDIIGELNAVRQEKAQRFGQDFHPIADGHAEISYCADTAFPDGSKIYPVIEQAIQALKSADWFDRSDSMTDYFHSAYYIGLQIGRWDKPFVCTAPTTDSTADTSTTGTGEQHYSDLTLLALINGHGWAAACDGEVFKTFPGIAAAGVTVPDGSRNLYAGYCFDSSRRRYIAVVLGDDELFDLDGRDRDPEGVARELDARVNAWVMQRRMFNSPTVNRYAAPASALLH